MSRLISLSVPSLEVAESLVSVDLSFTQFKKFEGIISINVLSAPISFPSALGTPVTQM